jgi:hypothetical protein
MFGLFSFQEQLWEQFKKFSHPFTYTGSSCGCTGNFPDGCTSNLPDGCTRNFPDGCTGNFPDGCTGNFSDGPDCCTGTGTYNDDCTGSRNYGCTCIYNDGCFDRPVSGSARAHQNHRLTFELMKPVLKCRVVHPDPDWFHIHWYVWVRIADSNLIRVRIPNPDPGYRPRGKKMKKNITLIIFFDFFS